MRESVLTAVLTLVCAGCAAGGGAPMDGGAAAGRPNVLLISIDALRADHLGSYGYARPTSPFLDELAAGGTRFANAFVNTHGTTPSHTTLLSSLFQEVHRVAYTGDPRDAVPADVTLVQGVFRDHGYFTLGVTGGGNVAQRFGFGRGFDRFDDQSESIDEAIERLLALLGEAGGNQRPIFAFLHTYEVHSPYAPPAPYRRMFGEFESSFEPTSANLLAVVGKAASLSPADLDLIVARYDGGIRFADDRLRHLFARLEAIGFLSGAVVAVTSDHGEEFGEHGGLLHRGLLYDEVVRVPLILSGRPIPAGRVSEDLVTSVDIAPTLLACAGLPVPPFMQGRRLACDRHAPPAPDAAIAQYGRNLYSLRTRSWKLIEQLDPPRTELYHLSEDPMERTNLASTDPERAARMRRQLSRWRRDQIARRGRAERAGELSEQERRRLTSLGYVSP